MKKLIILALAVFAYQTAFSQPAIWGATKWPMTNGDTTFFRNAQDLKTWMALTGGGTVTSVSVVSANGFAGTVSGTDIIASGFGGTGNGFTKFSGPTTSEKTFTLPNASATILTDNAAVTAAQGGTGQTTYAIGDILQASAATTLSKLAAVATGNVLISGGVTTVSSWGKVGLTSHVSGILPVANGGTALSAIGGDVTLLGSNGSANIYYTPAITHIDAAFGYSRSTTTMNLNIPNATAALGGIVSNTTQTFAGNKTWGGTHTNTGLITGNGGIIGVAGAAVASVSLSGPLKGTFTTVTVTTSVSESFYEYFAGTLTADITFNLPACNATRDGWTWRFLKKGTDAFAFILDPNAAETFFDGATTKTYFSQGSSVTCQCENGLGWNILR